MALKHLVDLDLGGNEIQNVVLQNLATAPSGVAGQIYYDTAAGSVKVHTGSGFVRVGLSADGSTITESNGTISVGTIAISNVSGLQTALNAKADTSALPEPSAILYGGGNPTLATGITAAEIRTLIGATTFNGAYSSLTGVPTTFTPSAHTHELDEVTGLITALDAKAPLASPALTGTPTAPTAAGGNNTTQIATTAFVSSEISRVIDAAPAALDTLNELAAAIGDDSNFAGTMTTALAGKLPTTHDMTLTLSGDVSGAATFTNMGNATLSVTVADDSHNHTIANVDGLQTALNAKLNSSAYTAADVLNKIKTVDGAGSGLDADLLDGQSSAYYRNYNNLTNKPTIPEFVSKSVTGTGANTDLELGLSGLANIQIYEAGQLVMTDIYQDGAGTATANIPNGLAVKVVAVGL